MGRLGELLVILAIVIMLFGTKRLKDFGGDLGAAIKGFRKNVRDEDKSPDPQQAIDQKPHGDVIDGKAETVEHSDQQHKQ
jgi:sec-independent protein translocase protein TatA